MQTLTYVILAACILHLAAPTNTTDSENSILNGANKFSQALFKNVQQNPKENLVLSPLSVYTALLMISFGAYGDTLTALQSYLPVPVDNLAVFSEAWNRLSINDENVVLNVANKIYSFRNVTPKYPFEAICSTLFNTNVENLDLENREQAVSVMNEWVDQHTNHKIQNIVNSDDIDDFTVMVLLNTIYFNGKWWDPFNTQNNVNETFYVDEYTNKTVEMMCLNQALFMGPLDHLDADFIILPYWDEKATMTIVVPREVDGLSKIEENLESLSHEALKSAGDYNNIYFYLPKFKIESAVDLRSPLEKMGMSMIFRDGADFTGIADDITKVSKISQKVVIEVNEKGTEAGVSTAMSLSDKSWTNTDLKVNRPSLAIVRVGEIDVFIVRIVDPTI